uniref:Uncharacterized protein n=1 Tax=viral metagenome TaxID=1070528 RepID=A0A6M3MBM9_9ZZZZ
MDEVKIIAGVIAVMFLTYIAIRLWAYGIFRSYFDAKKQDRKENKNAKTE